MRIIGIDPGLTRCGIGIVRLIAPRKLEFEHVEVLQTPPHLPLTDRLVTLGAGVQRLLEASDIDAVAIERVFAQSNLPSVMGVAHISGVVMYLAGTRGIPVEMYTPNEVKSQVTGYGAADKRQVTAMVTKHLGLQTAPKPADAADALALAITHAWSGSARRAHRAAHPQTSAGTPAQRAWLAAEQSAKRAR